jgi:aminoglycoside 6'-N-acetyltransferase
LPDPDDLTLEGGHVRLRPLTKVDLPQVQALLSDEQVAEWWGPYDEARLREELAGPNVSAWAILVDGAVGGMVVANEELDPDYRHVELDIFLGAAHHGKGLGSDALRTILRHLFERRRHHRAVIIPAAENERAIRSYARVGFRPVGVMRRVERAPDGRWRDALVMDLLAEELR